VNVHTNNYSKKEVLRIHVQYKQYSPWEPLWHELVVSTAQIYQPVFQACAHRAVDGKCLSFTLLIHLIVVFIIL
jgi:hypothetical protein